MHPNKKILNSKNSPWLLCPSKSFPGKFYYFNGSTGETAWSLNDADTKNLKKATIPTITDKTHSYPEPLGPPADESTNTTSSSQKKDFINSKDFFNGPFSNPCSGNPYSRGSFSNRPNLSTETNFSHPSTSLNFGHRPNYSTYCHDNVGDHYRANCSAPSPMFGQAVFPKYVSSEMCPLKVMWTLTPMLLPERQTHNQMFDQISQYEPQKTFAATVPLTNPYQSLERTVTQNPYQFNTSTPLRKSMFEQTLAQRFEGSQTFVPKPATKEEACQTLPKRTRTRSLSESTPKTILKPSRSVENLTSISDDKSLSTNAGIDDSRDTTDKLSTLQENDLRFLLVAKRRQSVSWEDTPRSTKEPIKNMPLDDAVTKKRVTFDLEDQETTSSEDVKNDDIFSPDSLEIESMEASRDHSEANSVWYIAADSTVLLTEFECIEQFVLSDKNCRLLIPYIVLSKIDCLSKGDCISRQSIIAARQFMRKLATQDPHIVVQQKPETVSASEEDAILKCCWQYLQENHVILITDNTTLLDKAKIIDIECHTLGEFKDEIKPTSTKDPFDLRKVKITISNNEKPTENLFQQTLKELNPFEFTQATELPARNTLFDRQNTENRTMFGRKDANNDKLIDLTNTNKALKDVCHSDVDKIDHDIRRLEITHQMTTRHQTRHSNFRMEFEDQNLVDKCKENREYQFVNDKRSFKISGITKLDSVFDLDEELKRFNIESDVVENRVKSRRDEWLCRLIQTMEDALTDVLLKEKVKVKKIIPPWSLCEAIQLTGDRFKKQLKIKTIIERFNIHLFNCTSSNGKLNENMKPIDLIKFIGFSMILIQNLKEIIDYIELNDADDRLGELIKNIEDPKTDIELCLDSIITPVLRRSDELESRTPMAFKNKQKDVLDYLKKHFSAMESYEFETDELKIVRTTGRDLNTIKIKSTKVEHEVDKVEPKVIRNVNVVDAFEKRMKPEIDLDSPDYEESVVTILSSTKSYNDCHDKMDYSPNGAKDNVKMDDLSDCSVMDESLSSAVYKECVVACSLMKSVFTELRRTLMLIYSFITESMQDYQQGTLFKNKKSDINIKTNMAYKYLSKIINRLKSIIARESGQGPTLKDLLIQAGDYVEEDSTMAQYRDEVTKYLEQALILEEALKILLTVAHENSDLDSI